MGDLSAKDMGHVPVAGADGSLRILAQLQVPNKIYVHINNTNPILSPGSIERSIVEQAGLEIARDGLEIIL